MCVPQRSFGNHPVYGNVVAYASQILELNPRARTKFGWCGKAKPGSSTASNLLRTPRPAPLCQGSSKMQKNPRNARFCLCTTAASGLNAVRSLTKQKLPMAKALSKSQIAGTVAEKVGITKKQAVQSLETLVELAYKNAKNTFTIPGLGKLVLVNRKARMGRNPATGATIKIAAKRVVKFRVAKAAKDAILGTK